MKCFSLIIPLTTISIHNHFITTTNAEQCNSDDPIACFNDGICKNGQKNYVELGLKSIPALEPSKRGMYCECPNEPAFKGHSGITGVHCNTNYEMCEDGKHMCLNGGTCEKIGLSNASDDDQYLCKCPVDSKSKVWAGLHCETAATDFCEEDDFYDITGGRWFCTQGGTCRNNEKNLARKCTCPQGTYGLHCEFNQEQECSLKCENDGVCKVGMKDFSLMEEYGLDIDKYLGGQEIYGEHCVCPDGFSGVTCQAEQVTRCGDGICMNGSECVQTVSIDGSTVYDEFCRCRADSNGSFAGTFCEYESTTFCKAPVGHNPKDYFCANYGECPLETHLPCKCPVGYTGARCEFPEEALKEEDCDLDCKNEGQCFFGQSPVVDEELKELHNEGLDFLLDNKHCRCPDDYVGLRCEMKFQRCPDNEHYCLHGSVCIPDGDQFTCDCNEASSKLAAAYAGKYCEHAATEFCEGAGAGTHSFCTNHGTCLGEIGKGEDHVGCSCEEGWDGQFCEYKSHATGGVATKAFLGFVGTLAGVILLFASLVFIYRKYNDNIEYEQPAFQQPRGTSVRAYVGEDDDDLSDFSEEDSMIYQDITIN